MRHTSTRHFIHLLLLALVPLAVLSVLVAPALADALGATEPAAQEKPAETSAATASTEETSASTAAPADADVASAPAATKPLAPAKAPAPAEPDYKFVAKWGNAFNSTTT
ncbi:MAG: hypothetical protein KH138_12485, partial [Firmicutes bacterium]|nr:hypothetical protein [Bacillota bacterium]